MSTPTKTYTSISHTLLTTHAASLTPSPPPSLKPTTPSLTASISSLLLHPCVETTLHLLNADLSSAHFLVRHMQSPPAVEGMLLHGILHRIEGDMDNARAWVGDVGDACEGWVPKKGPKGPQGGEKGEQGEQGERLEEDVLRKVGMTAEGEEEGMEAGLLRWVYGGSAQEARARALGLVDAVEAWRKRKGGEAERERLDAQAREELGRVLQWCEAKFGTREWSDASSAWVKNSEEIQSISDGMVSGGKGRRDF
ncbi:hypothetical protein E8E13_007857 [Curvularia kusanoi]|uniref:Uncharacterized protein n=1 Tax=Curvularia kusanoi TaxID=90978 RepID=A0A9P4TD53_CURKU|nr:hypothetical protein E8E13_007857 [Curvularia kusanoi]